MPVSQKDFPPEAKKRSAFSRRRFLKIAGIGVGVAGSAGVYARFIEPDWFEVTETRLPREKFPAPAGVRILQMSDFHFSGDVSLDMLAEALKIGVSLKPDLICLTGDFITAGFPAEDSRGERYAKLLSMLPAAAPTFACPGNHDYFGLPARGMRKFLASAGIRLLQNESELVLLEKFNSAIRVTGLDDLWNGHLDPAPCLDLAGNTAAGASVREPHLLLCHNPDGKESAGDYAWDLMLSGHTHGGQVCLPFVGAIYAPVNDRRFIAGLYEWKNRLLYVSRGIGNLHGIRFFCRPEISLFTV